MGTSGLSVTTGGPRFEPLIFASLGMLANAGIPVSFHDRLNLKRKSADQGIWRNFAGYAGCTDPVKGNLMAALQTPTTNRANSQLDDSDLVASRVDPPHLPGAAAAEVDAAVQKHQSYDSVGRFSLISAMNTSHHLVTI